MALRGEGVQGERVLLFGTTGLDFIASFFGILYAGAVAVPLSPARPSKASRLKAIVRDAKPKVGIWLSLPGSRVSQITEQVSDFGHLLPLASCLGTENGIEICAPIHDAFLICAAEDQLEADVRRMRAYMEEASAVVLDGFKLQTESELIVAPNRYSEINSPSVFERLASECFREVFDSMEEVEDWSSVFPESEILDE